MTTSNSDHNKLERFKTMLQTTVDDDEQWETLLAQLPDYIDAQLSGRNYTADFPTLAAALDASPELATAYERLYELEQAVRTNQLPAVTPPSPPNLNFLAPDKNTPFTERLQAAVTTIGQKIQLQLDEALFNLLTPPPAAALTRSTAATRYNTHLAHLTAAQLPQLDLELTVDIYQNSTAPDDCLIEVNVIPPGKSWPDLAGSLVTIQYAHTHATAETDAWGNVSFSELSYEGLENLQLEVLPA